MEAGRVCVSKETLRKEFNSALWHQVLEEQLKHLRSFPLSVLLCKGLPQNSLQLLSIPTTTLVGGLRLFVSMYQPNSSCFRAPPEAPHKLL